ncbi:MAG TPA: hypothetical protein PLY93_07495 [Turneriella sp.]|nr:hypothetical protein [Turneriella sp.]
MSDNDFLSHLSNIAKTMAAWIEKARESGRKDDEIKYQMYDFCHDEKHDAEQLTDRIVNAVRTYCEKYAESELSKYYLNFFSAVNNLVRHEYDYGVDMFDAAAATVSGDAGFRSYIISM